MILIWLSLIVLASVLAGVVYEALGRRLDATRHPPPGTMVDLGTHRLHVLAKGSGSPTVLLEAGLMSTVLTWTELQQQLSKSYLVVSYDRAGLGWSDVGPFPRTADRIVDELHLVLECLGIPPPYVLVGHSFGGLTMSLFAARYPHETAGTVLIDPVAPGEWNPPSERDQNLVRIAAKVCRRAAVLSRVGLIRFVVFLLNTRAKNLAAHFVRTISRGTPGQSGTVSSEWFWALPERERAMASVFWVQEKFAVTIASQLQSLPASATRIAELGSDHEKPAIILSASTATEQRKKEHQAMAQGFRLGKHLTAGKSNHWIMQQEPELILEAIRSAAEPSRSRRSGSAVERP